MLHGVRGVEAHIKFSCSSLELGEEERWNVQAMVVAREKGGMCWLGNGVPCVPDIFGVEGPIELAAFVRWNLIAQWVVPTGGND